LLIAKIEIITGPTWLTFTESQMMPSVYVLGVVERQAQASLNVEALFARHQMQSLITLTDSVANWQLAIQATARGHSWLSQSLFNLMLHQLRAPTKTALKPDVALTQREQEVLRELAKGAKNQEIAARLDIVESTVNFHLRNLRKKLNIRSRMKLIRWYQQAVLAGDVESTYRNL
jgi:DNA-binding NarL/FixJ family response regulator